jgi:hypothetical protein
MAGGGQDCQFMPSDLLTFGGFVFFVSLVAGYDTFM